HVGAAAVRQRPLERSGQHKRPGAGAGLRVLAQRGLRELAPPGAAVEAAALRGDELIDEAEELRSAVVEAAGEGGEQARGFAVAADLNVDAQRHQRLREEVVG